MYKLNGTHRNSICNHLPPFVISDPPIVTLRQENITVNETEDFDLFCDYVSNPSELKAVKW